MKTSAQPAFDLCDLCVSAALCKPSKPSHLKCWRYCICKFVHCSSMSVRVEHIEKNAQCDSNDWIIGLLKQKILSSKSSTHAHPYWLHFSLYTKGLNSSSLNWPCVVRASHLVKLALRGYVPYFLWNQKRTFCVILDFRLSFLMSRMMKSYWNSICGRLSLDLAFHILTRLLWPISKTSPCAGLPPLYHSISSSHIFTPSVTEKHNMVR